MPSSSYHSKRQLPETADGLIKKLKIEPNKDSSLSKVSNDVLQEVFGFLSRWELDKYPLVCRKFRNIIGASSGNCQRRMINLKYPSLRPYLKFRYNSAYKACLSHLDKYFRGNHARHDEKESIKNGEEFWIDAGKFGVDGKKTIRITSTESNALKNSIIDRLERHIIVGEACPVCYATVDEFREELEVISSFGNGPIHVREFALSLEIVGYKSGYDREYIERLKQIKTVFSKYVQAETVTILSAWPFRIVADPKSWSGFNFGPNTATQFKINLDYRICEGDYKTDFKKFLAGTGHGLPELTELYIINKFIGVVDGVSQFVATVAEAFQESKEPEKFVKLIRFGRGMDPISWEFEEAVGAELIRAGHGHDRSLLLTFDTEESLLKHKSSNKWALATEFIPGTLVQRELVIRLKCIESGQE